MRKWFLGEKQLRISCMPIDEDVLIKSIKATNATWKFYRDITRKGFIAVCDNPPQSSKVYGFQWESLDTDLPRESTVITQDMLKEIL